MKKLIMTVVAAAFAVGAFAECSYNPPAEAEAASAWAYKWTFTGKTTKAVKTNCGGDQYVVRTPSSLKIQGYAFYCSPSCGDFEKLECDEVFWVTKPARKLFNKEDGGLTFEVANVIGKKGDKFETAGKLTLGDVYDLTFAGLGKYDKKNTRPSSIRGNFAGIAAAPTLLVGEASACGDPLSTVSTVWECCGCPTAEAGSVAFGKFKVKYAKKYAKKYAAGTLSDKFIPSWAR